MEKGTRNKGAKPPYISPTSVEEGLTTNKGAPPSLGSPTSVAERKKASDFPPQVMDLFNSYVHGGMSRRDFLDRATKYAVGGVTAAAMLESLRPNYAFAQQIAKNDSRIKADYVNYPSPQGSGTMRGYLAQPANFPTNASGKLPGVVVYHENRGLNPYVEDVARRLATANFVAFAPDALFPLGGYPGDEEKAAAMYRQLDPNKRIEDMMAAATFLKARPECTGKIGAVGFCAGGGVVNVLATRMPDLGAAVPFYGPQPGASEAARIRTPMLLQYAEKDDFVNGGRAAFETALKAAGVQFEAHVYPGTLHGFHNDSTPRYVESEARIAWQRSVDFFNKHLRA
jgi:carboxymethylenebutenolidase